MIYEQAEALLAELLTPVTTDEFFGALGKASFDSKAGANTARCRLFGTDPKRTLLEGFGSHAAGLDYHAKVPRQPPPDIGAVADPAQFEALIRSFHQRGYTVRVPDVVPLSPDLQLTARALEFMIRRPVSAAVFWSAAGAEAPVHYDKPDNIVVQLEGRKRWYISTDPPGLQNKWMQVGEPLPTIERHRVFDVEPGDLIYIPHGTPHTVESLTESLHLAIVFEPMSVKDAIIAAVEFLSDHDRAFRETAIGRVQDTDISRLSGQVADGLGRLLAECRSEDFLKAAMDMRWSRSTAELPALPKSPAAAVTRETVVRQSPLAISYLRPSFGSLDFSQPGSHLAIHAGVQQELQFLASTDSFRVAEIPGGSSDDVKIALVMRMIENGFLEIAS